MAERVPIIDPTAVFRRCVASRDFRRMEDHQEAFDRACNNVCDEEVAASVIALRSIGHQGTDAEMRKLAVSTHWGNPICAICYERRHDKLHPCQECLLQFYCSEECEEKHWEFHKTQCRVKDAVFDAKNDLYRPAIVKLNPVKE